MSDLELLELANRYEKNARHRVLVEKKYPLSRYSFTQKEFRPINGWDKEWYDVMNGWVRILESRGWKQRWADEKVGESMMGNFQYIYDSDPVDSGVPQYSCTWDKIDLSKLNPQYCSQMAVND